MSRKGENIYKRKDGRWGGRYKKGYTANGRTLYGSCYSKTYKEVKEKLEMCKLQISTGQFEGRRKSMKTTIKTSTLFFTKGAMTA